VRRSFLAGAWAGATLAACGGGESTGPAIDVARVEVTPAVSLAVGVGDTVRFVASPRDARGRPLAGVTVTWRVADGRVASVDAGGVVKIGRAHV